MIPIALLTPIALRALKFLIAVPKLRAKFKADMAAEGGDVSPAVVSALDGDADAIRLLADQIDEALGFNAGARLRLEDRVRREQG